MSLAKGCRCGVCYRVFFPVRARSWTSCWAFFLICIKDSGVSEDIEHACGACHDPPRVHCIQDSGASEDTEAHSRRGGSMHSRRVMAHAL